VTIGGVPRGTGEGGSKKQAEQAAARDAWMWLHVAEDGELGEASGDGPPRGERRSERARSAETEATRAADTRAGTAMGGTNAGAT
jgi:hypothetical protein